MSESKTFHIGDVLSITTGRLVSKEGMGGVHRMLDFMTQDELYTHQLPRAMDECRPWLLRQHPQLAGVEVPDEFSDEAHVWSWLDEQIARYGETLLVEPIPADDQTHRDPIAELAEMVPPEKIVVVDAGRE